MHFIFCIPHTISRKEWNNDQTCYRRQLIMEECDKCYAYFTFSLHLCYKLLISTFFVWTCSHKRQLGVLKSITKRHHTTNCLLPSNGIDFIWTTTIVCSPRRLILNCVVDSDSYSRLYETLVGLVFPYLVDVAFGGSIYAVSERRSRDLLCINA